MEEKQVNGVNGKYAKSEILSWNLERNVTRRVNFQIELLSKHIVKIENKEERRNRYLPLLKYLFCYAENSGLQDILKMELSQEKDFTTFLKTQTAKSNINATETCIASLTIFS